MERGFKLFNTIFVTGNRYSKKRIVSTYIRVIHNLNSIGITTKQSISELLGYIKL